MKVSYKFVVANDYRNYDFGYDVLNEFVLSDSADFSNFMIHTNELSYDYFCALSDELCERVYRAVWNHYRHDDGFDGTYKNFGLIVHGVYQLFETLRRSTSDCYALFTAPEPSWYSDEVLVHAIGDVSDVYRLRFKFFVTGFETVEK